MSGTRTFRQTPEWRRDKWVPVPPLVLVVCIFVYVGLMVPGICTVTLIPLAFFIVLLLLFSLPNRELAVENDRLVLRSYRTITVRHENVDEISVSFAVPEKQSWEEEFSAQVYNISVNPRGRFPIYLSGEHFSGEQLNQIYCALRCNRLLREGARWSRYYLRHPHSTTEVDRYQQALEFLEALCSSGSGCWTATSFCTGPGCRLLEPEKDSSGTSHGAA